MKNSNYWGPFISATFFIDKNKMTFEERRGLAKLEISFLKNNLECIKRMNEDVQSSTNPETKLLSDLVKKLVP